MTRRPDRSRWLTVLVGLLLTVGWHAALLAGLAAWDVDRWLQTFTRPVTVEMLDPTDVSTDLESRFAAIDAAIAAREEVEEEEVPEPEPPPPPQPSGQIVETPRPDVERVPVTAQYLDAHDNAVPEEMRSARFKVNPEVLSNVYSTESKYKTEDLADVGATEMSTGATVGGPGLETPGKGPPRSALPSQWSFTNKEGLASPVPASSRTQEMAGAPQNDLLNEKIGPATALNTRKLLGAEYYNRIRRLVNFYWQQNLDNLPGSVRLSLSQYTTEVDVVLDAQGGLERIEVARSSGLEPVDGCVVDAFAIAAPFPTPPQALVAPDGRVYLPDFEFTVNVGRAALPYQGVDPRAGVQFPGILKSPR